MKLRLSILLFVLWHSLGWSAQIQVPTSVPNTDSLLPFALEQFNIQSCRFQQVYGTSAFSTLSPGGQYITELRFRADPGTGRGFETVLPDVQINFSVTARGPDTLSTTFAENIGMNEQTVVGRGPLSLSTLGSPVSFDLRIVLTTPYFYDPALGHLLMDVRNYRALPPPHHETMRAGPLDAANVLGDTVSYAAALDVAAPSGFANSAGLVTLFVTQPIPEPSTWALLATALVMSGGGRWLRRRGNG